MLLSPPLTFFFIAASPFPNIPGNLSNFFLVSGRNLFPGCSCVYCVVSLAPSPRASLPVFRLALGVFSRLPLSPFFFQTRLIKSGLEPIQTPREFVGPSAHRSWFLGWRNATRSQFVKSCRSARLPDPITPFFLVPPLLPPPIPSSFFFATKSSVGLCHLSCFSFGSLGPPGFIPPPVFFRVNWCPFVANHCNLEFLRCKPGQFVFLRGALCGIHLCWSPSLLSSSI